MSRCDPGQDTPPLSSVSPRAHRGAARGPRPGRIQSKPCAPVAYAGSSLQGEEPPCVRWAGPRVNRDPRGRGPRRAPPTPLPQQAASTGSRPVIPTPRATLLGREAPGLSLRAHLPGDQILLRRRLYVQKRPGHGSAPGVATAPGRGAPRTMDGRDPPQTALIGYLERPLKLCFPIGRYGVQLVAGRRRGRRHCGRCSPSTQTTQAAGLGEAFGVESLGGAQGPDAGDLRAGPSGLQCWPEL